MTFRSLATLEGGTPADTSDTPGEPAGTRWVGFGEQVTSSIANRPHHALGENTDDLNTRLVVWETDGLDAAYDLGGAATPGGGRVITKDAGAVETSSGLLNDYADDPANAHYRANVINDSIDSSVGYDHKGGFDPTEVINGSGGIGFLDRRRVAVRPAGFASEFAEGESVTLNPGGVLGDTIRLTDGSYFWTSEGGPTPPAGNYTSLFLGLDLIEVTGTANNDGLYIIDALGGVGTDVKVTTLDGSTASFVSDASGTATVYRMKLGTVGSSTSRTALSNNILAASLASDSAVDLIGGDDVYSGRKALRVLFHGDDGTLVTGSWIDEFGRINWNLESSDLPYNYAGGTAERRRIDGGAYATKIDRTGHSDIGFGHISKTEDSGPFEHYDFLSLDLVDPAGTGLDGSIACVFTANSPINGELAAKAGELSGDWRKHLIPDMMLVELIPSVSGDVEGFYWLFTTNDAADGEIYVYDLDGTISDHLPTSGDVSIRIHALTAALGRRSSFAGVTNLDGTSNITPYNIFTGGSNGSSNAVAATFLLPEQTSVDSAFWRAYSLDIASGSGANEVAYLLHDGAMGALSFTRYSQAGENRNLPLTSGVDTTSLSSMVASSLEAGWGFDYSGPSLAPSVQSQVDLAIWTWPIRLAPGSEIQTVSVMVEPGDARATVSNRMKVELVELTPDFGDPPSISETILDSDEDDGSTDKQVLSLAGSYIIDGSKLYELRVTAGNTAGSANDHIGLANIGFLASGVDIIPEP